jgi:predicted PurR-regulated permease PerM
VKDTVKRQQRTDAGPGRQLATGPLAWVAALACTTLLLAMLKSALWLVVPSLFAIILYYMLYPAVRYLTLTGVERQKAAALVVGSFFAVSVVAMVPVLSWLTAQTTGGEDLIFRYLEGGRLMVDRMLASLEAHFGFLKRMELQAEVGRKIEEFGKSYVKEHLPEVLLAIAGWLPALLLAPFIAFFSLRDGRHFLKFLINAVPNAYYERTLDMVDCVDDTARAYFQGLLKLTLLDTLCLALGLWIIGMPGALTLGLMAALLAWVPYLGSVVAAGIVALVAATDFPSAPWMVYAALGLFLIVRLLDDFVFMPLTVGRSLHMHPLPTVLLIFIGGAVAGVPGLVLVLPLAGVVMVVAGTIGGIINDPRLHARHAYAKTLRARRINADLQW